MFNRKNISIAVSALVLFSCPVLSQDKEEKAPAGKGPMVYLCCKDTNGETNPINEFMYFVPLISPVEVTNQKSENNHQIGYVTSCNRRTKNNSFSTSCEFRMEGQGTNLNDFDKKGMILRNERNAKKGQSIKNILDYIKFNGEGYGRIDIQGDIKNGVKTVKKVEVYFNSQGHKSPVYVGLYSIKPKHNKYLYENRTDVKVARVNVLTFSSEGEVPRMDIKVDGVGKDEESLGFIEGIVGAIANLIIAPMEITEIGNDEMLKLGMALYEDKPTFTFPKAENLVEK